MAETDNSFDDITVDISTSYGSISKPLESIQTQRYKIYEAK